MIDETNIQVESESFFRQKAEQSIANFQRKRLHAEYVPDRKAALARILELIPPNASIGKGDSVTLSQIGIMAALKKSGGHQIFDPQDRGEEEAHMVRGEDRLKLQRQAMLADVFLSGANAITLDGKVVCTDGNGNRVAALIFGPKKVIIVAGVNKIVANLDEAFKRIHEIACPINARRHVVKHHASELYLEKPCVKIGKCTDCTHMARECIYTIIIEAAKSPELAGKMYPPEHLTRVYIVIVGETLGI